MRKRIAYTAALAIAGAALVPAAAQAGNTNVTISYNGSNTFVGQVKSQKNSCRNGRKVTLFLKGPGKDEKLGSDKSEDGKGDSEGVWIVQVDELSSNLYYAKVPEKGNCDADKSKELGLAR